MSDNNKYSLWDEVYKLQNKETNNFNNIVEALREICERMKKDECKPKKEKNQEKNIIQKQRLSKSLNINHEMLNNINSANKLCDLLILMKKCQSIGCFEYF